MMTAKRMIAGLLVTMMLVTAVSGTSWAAQQEPETETEQETEQVYEKETVMFLTDTVRVRAAADAESETVAFADRGSAVTVLGEWGDWYHVRLDNPTPEETENGDASEETEAAGVSEEAEAAAEEDESHETEASDAEPAKEGYIYGEYLTGVKAEAEQAVEANNAEIRRKEAEAAAAAAAAASSGGSGSSSGSKKKVTGTQNVPDCDGSNHGTTITTYSDGSTSTKRY